MIIESVKYKKKDKPNHETLLGATIDGIACLVPMDLGNRHYAEIMRQVDAGELTIEPADE